MAFTPLAGEAEARTLAFLRAHGEVGAGSLLEQMQRG
jgi:hypothetical protein